MKKVFFYKSLIVVTFCLIFCMYTYTIKAENIEEKIECAATINDDFSLNSIIVILNKEETFKFRKYTPSYFKKFGFVNVINLSKNTEKNVKKQLRAMETGDYDYLRQLAESENIIDIDKYRTKLCLEFPKCSPQTEKEKYEVKEKILNIVEELSQKKEFIYVGVNYDYETNSTEINDPKNSLNKPIMKNVKLFDAWEISTGSETISVGVIDTGIFGQHEDLVDNVDQTLSKSFSDTLTNPLIDEANHGTSVAGVIGAKPNNGLGVAGVCWNVNLVSLKVSEIQVNSSGTTEYVCPAANVVEAIDYAVKNNIMILNCSIMLKNSNVKDTLLEQAINEYPGIVVCSAGNQGRNLDDTTDFARYPASYDCDNIICVGATDGYSGVHQTSNKGNISVDVFAPGLMYNATSADGTYRLFGETSCAAPVVTGLVVLLKAYRPYFSVEEIKNVIIGTVDVMKSFEGRCVSNGRINLLSALQQCDLYHDHSSSGKCTYINASSHYINCPCGTVGTYPHVVLSSNLKMCIYCKHEITTGFIGINSVNEVYISTNGSYIMENGVIVLNENDLESFKKDSLVFYDKNNSNDNFEWGVQYDQ